MQNAWGVSVARAAFGVVLGVGIAAVLGACASDAERRDDGSATPPAAAPTSGAVVSQAGIARGASDAIDGTLASELRVSGAMPLYLPGDVDGSGRIDDADEAMLRAMVDAPAIAQRGTCAALADLDRDGAVTRRDVERLAETRRALAATGHVVAWPRTKVGTCGAVLPFAVPVVARAGEVVVLRPLPGAPALATKVHTASGEVLGADEARALGAPAGGVAIRLNDASHPDWQRLLRRPFVEAETAHERSAVDIVVSVELGAVVVDVPISVEVSAPASEPTKGSGLANPEGQPKVPIVRGDALYADGTVSGTLPGATGAACPHAAKRGASFVVNLLANWKYDSPDAQAEQKDELDKMHGALTRASIENDFVHYEGYDDPHLYPRPQRMVWLTPTKGSAGVQSQASDTLAIGEHADVTIGTPPAAVTTVDAIVTSQSTTITQQATDLAKWRGDEDAAFATVEQLFAGFEQMLAQGRSWVFFYVGSHGSPPDAGAPPVEQYGYWSTGLGWRIWWNRAEYLERTRAKAALGGACYFTAFDDSCYSGYTARFGVDSAAKCAGRPATSLVYQGQKEDGDQWLGVSTDDRTAGLGECIAREQELVDAIAAANASTGADAKQWLWWLRPTNFGQTYVDRGRNAAECVP